MSRSMPRTACTVSVLLTKSLVSARCGSSPPTLPIPYAVPSRNSIRCTIEFSTSHETRMRFRRPALSRSRTEEPIGTPEGRRVMQLLWDPPTTSYGRGPKPRTSLVEWSRPASPSPTPRGWAALSMRKVAQQLGLGAMSLYTYVPGRTELVELMIDRVYGETRRPPGRDRGGPGWSTGAAKPGALRRHPWLLEYNAARLPIGPARPRRRGGPVRRATGRVSPGPGTWRWPICSAGSCSGPPGPRSATPRSPAHRRVSRGVLGGPGQLLGHLLRPGPVSGHGGRLGGGRLRRHRLGLWIRSSPGCWTGSSGSGRPGPT